MTISPLSGISRPNGITGTLTGISDAGGISSQAGGAAPHPLAYLFDGVDGFLYDGAYSSGGVDFGTDSSTACTASGDPCGFVRDHSGNGWNLEQATSANKLTFRTTVGGIKSFITGPTTNGGSAKWAEVAGSTALPLEYTDITVLKMMKLNDPEGDILWDVNNFTGTGGGMDASYRIGYAGPGTPTGGTYSILRSAGGNAQWVAGGANNFPVINGTGFVFLAYSDQANVSHLRAQQTPDTLTLSGGAGNFVVSQNAFARVRIGYDVDYKIINGEYAFRMRIHRLLTTEEITAVLDYLNTTTDLSAWTGGTP